VFFAALCNFCYAGRGPFQTFHKEQTMQTIKALFANEEILEVDDFQLMIDHGNGNTPITPPMIYAVLGARLTHEVKITDAAKKIGDGRFGRFQVDIYDDQAKDVLQTHIMPEAFIRRVTIQVNPPAVNGQLRGHSMRIEICPYKAPGPVLNESLLRSQPGTAPKPPA
jgi:hypothetical protein